MDNEKLNKIKTCIDRMASDMYEISTNINDTINNMPPLEVKYTKVLIPANYKYDSNGNSIWYPDRYEYYLDDIFKSFNGNVFVWKWVSGSWNPVTLDDYMLWRFEPESTIFKSIDKLNRSKKLDTILEKDNI